MSIFTFLQTATAGAPTGQNMGSLVLTIVAMVAIFYFFLIRPQKKQEKETKKMLEALKKGDKIVTIGGIYGTVSSVKDTTVVVKVDDNTKIEFTKTAISKVVNSDNTSVSTEAKAKTTAKKDNNVEKKEESTSAKTETKVATKKVATKKSSKAKK